ncbi:MAG: hypothetical protein ABI543_08255 [Ignavibacteria bacterium]
MLNNTIFSRRPLIFPKLFSLGEFRLNSVPLTKKQLLIFVIVLVASVIVKLLIIDYNMIDHGEGATRTWNAFWWAQNPFFVKPLSGNPGWFYLIGPLIMITNEIYYTPIIVMIFAVTLAGIYIFKITLLFAGFRTSMLAFFIFLINPVIFRLNFTPIPQQLYLASICIMIFYFIKAIAADESRQSIKYFLIAGVFSFICLLFRAEGLFILLGFCMIALNLRKPGSYLFVFLTILFQIIWMGISYQMYGDFFKTFTAVRDYDFLVGGNIEGLNLKVRLMGFFMPAYFIVVGMTFVLFYFLVKGAIITYKTRSFLIFLILLFPIFLPAFINGLYGTISNLYLTTRYFYLTFYLASIITAFGLDSFLVRFNSKAVKYSLASVIILSAIPLSYIKDFVPVKYNKLVPKVIQFIATSEDSQDARQLMKFIEENILSYPSLIFDTEGSDSSILTIPFRTKLAPPEKIMISGYNIPVEKQALTAEILSFMGKNKKGIIFVKKEPTLMNSIFTELMAQNKNPGVSMTKAGETNKWVIFLFEPTQK